MSQWRPHAMVAFAVASLLAPLAPSAPVAAQQEIGDETVFTAPDLRLPGTFVGTLPCVDCPGIDVRLDLWPDQAYHLRRTYQDTDRVEDVIGHWAASPGRPTLYLDAVDDYPLQFEISSQGRLRLLEPSGFPIGSDLPHELTQEEAFEPFEPETSMRGEVRYMADAAIYRDCRTRRSYPVAFENAWIDLERAYLEHAPEPGGPLMATFRGRIAERPPMEGDGTLRTVVVDEVDGVWPGERCAMPVAEASLIGVYWRIVELEGTAIDPMAGRQEAHIALFDQDGGPRFAATLGCNRMGGGVSVDGPSLRFDGPMSTMMACPPPLDDQERRFAEMLGRTTAWRLEGTRLEFRDDAGVLAVMEAAYMR